MNSSKKFQPFHLKLSRQWLITVFLLIILAVTRSNYLPSLPDASWAIFFVIGFYLRSYIGLLLIVLSASIIDFAVIAARGGHQDYYLTPSYLFIIPAYAVLWFAGRYYAHKYNENLQGLITFIAIAALGIISCDLISSGGFYWMSTKFIDLSVQEFINRTVEFMPQSLMITLLYLGIAAIVHIIFVKALKFK